MMIHGDTYIKVATSGCRMLIVIHFLPTVEEIAASMAAGLAHIHSTTIVGIPTAVINRLVKRGLDVQTLGSWSFCSHCQKNHPSVALHQPQLVALKDLNDPYLEIHSVREDSFLDTSADRSARMWLVADEWRIKHGYKWRQSCVRPPWP